MIKPLWAALGALAFLGTAGAAAVYVGSSGGEEEVVRLQETATPEASASPSGVPSISPSSTPEVSPTLTPEPLPTLPSVTTLPTVPAGFTLYRWVNLTVLIPNGSGITAGPGAVENYPSGPLHFVIVKVDPADSRIASTVVLDSETGIIVEEQVLGQHRAELDGVRATVTVSPLMQRSLRGPTTGSRHPIW